ncbi:MAG: hypothetical protein JXB04_01400 [Kiritimatiellae bacterium]|nr:hypothetical protein [Kiritimatiellia bacterium]
MKKLMVICLCALAGCKVSVDTVGEPAPGPMHVLCLASEDLKPQGLDSIEEKALAAYRAMGFELHFDYYQRVDEATLRRYPVVVGMTPQLHAGTRAIDENLGAAIERYVRDGGGFLLIPGPSYYGGEDFVRQLNPWLKPLGVELLNDQPRDAANQKTITRVIGYRYLRTANIKSHPATDGIEAIWLPIDFTDGYLCAHTMKVSPDWDVLIRGETTCRTYRFSDLRIGRETAGAYQTEPPFLAIREMGKGAMAVFTSASGYYLFDAYHWAYGDGFVMKEGQGLQLMANLFGYLARGQSALARAAGSADGKLPAPAGAKAEVVEGNVPLVQDKGDWIEHVQKNLAPRACGVAGYVDCGALSDRAYSPERGWGYVGDSSWLIRWSWSEAFHPTAANSRGFDIKPLVYRFDGLALDRNYKLGVLTWAYQVEGARPIRISMGGVTFEEQLTPPRYADGQGPLFKVFDVPREAVREDGALEVSFELGEGGTGTFSSIAELWLFDEGAAALFAPEELASRFESPSAGYNERLFDHFKTFKGLIGARSTFSGGAFGVDELCAAAREAGCDFLVFVEDIESMTDEKLDELKAACAKCSDDSFRAMPGVRFSARYAGQARRADQPTSWGDVSAYVFQRIEKLPAAADFENPYSLLWKFFGGELTGGKGAPPTLSTPKANAISPFYQRFWRGLDVLTIGPGGEVQEDARGLYADLMAGGYGPQPRVARRYETPDEIRAARDGGWFVTITAPDLDLLPDYAYGSCIGNGPQLRHYGYSFDYARHGGTGEGILFRGQVPLILHAWVVSPTPIERVTLYSGTRSLRRWRPRSLRFHVEEPILVGRNHELWLHVEAQEGREAITGRFLVQNNHLLIGMCADNQNTICNLTRPPKNFKWDDRELFLAHSYWHTGEAAGQLGAMRDAKELVPRIIETGIIQPVKRFQPCPLFRFSDGTLEDHTSSELRLTEAVADYNRIEYRFDTPDSRMKSRTVLTTPLPVEGGDTVVLVEWEAEAKTDVEFAPGPLAIQHLRMGLVPALAPGWKCSYIGPSGAVETQPFVYEADPPHIRADLSPEGGVLVWPNDIGSLLLLPLDGAACEMDAYALASRHRRESVELGTSPSRMAAGEKMSSRILVALHQGEVASGEEVAALRRRYAGQAERLALQTGRLASAGYLPTIETENYVVAGTADTSALRDPMPLAVKTVNPNWSVAKQIDGELTVLEAPAGEWVVTLPPGRREGAFALGNVLISDREDLVMEWGGFHMGGVRMHVHHPGDAPAVFRAAANPAMHAVPPVDGRWALDTGESVWLWGHGDLLLRESRDCQVISARALPGGEIEIGLTASGVVEFTGPYVSATVDGTRVEVRAQQGRRAFDVDPGRHTVVFRPGIEVKGSD